MYCVTLFSLSPCNLTCTFAYNRLSSAVCIDVQHTDTTNWHKEKIALQLWTLSAEEELKMPTSFKRGVHADSIGCTADNEFVPLQQIRALQAEHFLFCLQSAKSSKNLPILAWYEYPNQILIGEPESYLNPIRAICETSSNLLFA